MKNQATLVKTAESTKDNACFYIIHNSGMQSTAKCKLAKHNASVIIYYPHCVPQPVYSCDAPAYYPQPPNIVPTAFLSSVPSVGTKQLQESVPSLPAVLHYVTRDELTASTPAGNLINQINLDCKDTKKGAVCNAAGLSF